MKFFGLVLGVATAGLFAASAQAGVIYPGPSGDMPTNQSLTVTFNASAGTTGLSFTIDGYNTLDGNNFYEDDFFADPERQHDHG